MLQDQDRLIFHGLHLQVYESISPLSPLYRLSFGVYLLVTPAFSQ